MAGSRTSAPETPAKQEPHAAAPAAPPLPFGLGASIAKEEKTEESSGDEVCFNERPLFTAGRPARGALARAKMISLGCAKKEKLTPEVSVETISDVQGVEGYSKPITSVAPVPNRSVPEDDISDSSEEAEVADDCRWRRGTWWAQFFQLKLLSIGAGAASLKVSMAQMNLTDVDLPSLTSALDRLLLDLRRSTQEDLVESDHWPPVCVSMELDLSDNEISDAGAVWLFGWLMQRPNELRCRVLRMARNRLGDIALEWLSALVCQQHSAIEELHLADNAITATGAAHVLMAFALHPFEAYPFLDPRGLFAPVALSLDRNPIQEPGLLARLRLRANLRAACKDGNLRTAKFSLAPHVQLGANFPDAGVSMVLPLALEKVCAGGTWPSLPQLPKPLPKDIEVETNSLGRLKTFRRELVVDDEEGAGLELETVSDGLRICQIFEIPGQPGLRVGDILVAIDGLPLWWKVCQRDKIEIDEDDDAPSARFRARFRRGARLDVMRPAEAVRAPTQAPRSHRFACPVCWDTFNRWNDCLEHLREFGHEPTPVSSKLEDASGSLRRWMATCMAAARGEIPRPGHGSAVPNGSLSPEQWMATEEDDTLLLPASIGVLGERSRMVIEALAEEASRFGFEHGCTVWTLPNGLRAQCPSASGSASVASMADELLQIMHFHLPDVDDKESPCEEDEELAEWTAWLEQMLQQQAEETRQRAAPLSMIETSLEDTVEQPDDSIRMVLLCGLPGSGKSTLARSFAKSSKWCVVNQDTLGSRQACLKVARNALTRPPNERGHIVIDRCNVTRSQRGIWTHLASEFHLAPSQVACVWLDVSNTECARRVLQRFGHRTLPPQNASLKVIEGFASKWQAPDVSEGFGRLWRLSSDADQEMFLSDFGLSAPEPSQPEATREPERTVEVCKGPTVEVTPLASRKEKAGSNKIVAAPVSVMEVKEVEVPLEPVSASLPCTWTCACGEINKLRREVCNNCFAEKTRSPRAPSPAVAVAAPTTATAKVEVQISPEPEEVKSTSPGADRDLTLSADFWRLPLEPLEDLSPP